MVSLAAYTRRRSNRDRFSFKSNTKHFQFTNIAFMSLEVLDLDFDDQSTWIYTKSRATIFMRCLWVLLWIEGIVKGFYYFCREFICIFFKSNSVFLFVNALIYKKKYRFLWRKVHTKISVTDWLYLMILLEQVFYLSLRIKKHYVVTLFVCI